MKLKLDHYNIKISKTEIQIIDTVFREGSISLNDYGLKIATKFLINLQKQIIKQQKHKEKLKETLK